MQIKMFKSVFVIAVLLVLKVLGTPLSAKIDYETRSQVIALEEPCVRQGGLCIYAEDCAPSTIVWLGSNLCPKQNHIGVVCCYL